MNKERKILSFRELVSFFPKELSYRIFEYIFLSSSRITNLNDYERFKDELIDFRCRLNEKLKRKLLDKQYPVQRVAKCTFFNNRKFYLFEGVFDPRPETEQLITITKELVKELKINFFTYLDLCSGSGAIYISLLLEIGNQIFYSTGVDSSERACQNTLENLFQLKVQGNHKVYLSNWDKFLEHHQQWEVITMNPPYLSIEEWNSQLKYDPKNSLVAKQKGLAHYIRFLDYLKKNKYWKLVVLECSEFHEEYWKKIGEMNHNWNLKRYKDYLGKFRIVSIARK